MKMVNSQIDNLADTELGSLSVETLDDKQFSGMNLAQLLEAVPADYPHTHLFVFDDRSAAEEECSLTVLDLHYQNGRTFRTVPEEVESIDNNLSISNMDWEDFTTRCDEEGVFRGFSG